MTVFKRGKVFHHDFWYHHKRYWGTTEQLTQEDAEHVELEIRKRLRQDAWGIAPTQRTHALVLRVGRALPGGEAENTRPPRRAREDRPHGARLLGPAAYQIPPVAGGVYHDLRLADPMLDADWLERFEQWMDRKAPAGKGKRVGLSGSAKNSYRSALSGMYKLAMKPRFRKKTNVAVNPFEHIDRDRGRKRRVRLPVHDLRRWVECAAPHVRLALAIGALAPKLRLTQVLALRFDTHIDPALTTIVFERHKTRRHTGEDQATPISADLRLVLQAVQRAHPDQPCVITFRGAPVASLRRAIKSAAERAGLAYGMRDGQVTFHALRHAMATEIARLGITEALAAATLGHKDLRTTRQHYIHLVSEDERAVVDQLGRHLGLTDGLVSQIAFPNSTADRSPNTTRHRRRKRVILQGKAGAGGRT